MHLDLTPEALLTQLGYTHNPQTLKQINDIIANTKGFEKFSPHIPSFNDALAVENDHWADKYKLELKKIDNKNTYYIIGHK